MPTRRIASGKPRKKSTFSSEAALVEPEHRKANWKELELDDKDEVFAMGDDSDHSEEDSDLEDSEASDVTQERKHSLKKMPGLRKKLGAHDEEEEEEEEEEQLDQSEEDDVDVMAWGKGKNLYYNDDADLDDEAAAAEEREAIRLPEERAQSMAENDFTEGFKAAAADDCASDTKTLPKELPHLSREEIMEHVANESPEFLRLLADLQSKVDEVTEHARPLLERVQSGNAPMSKGVSLLEVKNQLLLNYCLNMAFYFYLKADGKRVQGHPVIEKLVETRLYLDKIKPLEQKMKYQIDKLVKAAVTGETSATQDALAYRPNPQDLVTRDEDRAANGGGAGDGDDGDEDEKSGVYRAPQIAPVPYDEDPGAEERRRKASERARKRASGSRLMNDLMEEMTDMPEEITDAGNMLVDAKHDDKEWEDRVRAEEDMMVRLPMTRQDKKKMKARGRFANELENLDDFGDMSYLNDLDADQRQDLPSSSAAAASSSGNKKKSMRSIIRNGLAAAAADGDEETSGADRKRKQRPADDIPYRTKQRKQHERSLFRLKSFKSAANKSA